MIKPILSILAVFVTLSTFAALTKPIHIAILDSPLDYTHPQIQAVIDEDLLKNTKLLDDDGVEKTWHQLNIEAKAEFEKRFNRKLYVDQVKFLDAMNALSGQLTTGEYTRSVFINFVNGYLKYISSRKFRTGLNAVATYLHGTHVAGIAVRSLTDIRLIHFPFITSSEPRLKISEILHFDAERDRKNLRTYFAQIAHGLKEHGVRVVNLSVGTSNEIAQASLNNRLSLLQRLLFKKQIKEVADQNSKVYIEELSAFIKDLPETIFVVAAGNEKSDLSQIGQHSAKIKLPNVVSVAALDDNLMRASFSNFSSHHVEISAVGVAIKSALVGGGEIHMSGTSQAAPAVTRTLAQILTLQPSLSAAEAIQVLLTNTSTRYEALDKIVANGKVLNKEFGPQQKQEPLLPSTQDRSNLTEEEIQLSTQESNGKANCSKPF